MPKNGATARGRQMATLGTLAHSFFTDSKFGEVLKRLCEDDTLSEDQRLNVKLVSRDYERKKKYPSQFVETLSYATSEAFGKWHEARSKSDFSIFKPSLEKIVKLKREETDLVGYGAHRYEALLEDYEPGLTVKKIDAVFSDVKRELFPFIKQILSRPAPCVDFLEKKYPKDLQWKFSEMMVRQIGYDFSSGRADMAPHPFCTTFGPGDVRITIRSDEHHFNTMFFAAIHEAGHALYELGVVREENYSLPLGTALSLAFHESQSRFWENNIARSLPYWKGNFPRLTEIFPENLRDVSVESFYQAVNRVSQSFIRVEADELTYHAHIYIRYLIEKALISGEIEVGDVPKFWNDRYEEYLGIRPKNDTEGCLQDVHWAYGSMGYFPTYSLGSFYAAQLRAHMKKTLPDFEGMVTRGEMAPLLTWLRENIHRTGRRYTSEELLMKATGEGLQFGHFMDYAKEKYGKIYGIK
jgi:carboxypeptidase Taq